MITEHEWPRFRKKLLAERNRLMDIRDEVDTQWRTLHQPEPEYEETAQKEKLSQPLDALDDRERREIEAIDRALRKIEAGSYGICESCGDPISEERLEAIPWTPLCHRCAEESEKTEEGKESEPTVDLSKADLPPDLEGLSDHALCDRIRDRLKADGRVHMEELTVSCKRGVVYMEGFLPDHAERQAMRQLLEDVMGLPKVVDRLVIDPVLWEREDRTPGREEIGEEEKEVMPESEEMREGAYVSRKSGTPYTPPDTVVPEKEK